MKLEIIDPHELRFCETNARAHPEKSVKAIMKSVQQFGQQKPIIVTQELEVIAGHGLLIAAMRLELPKVLIIKSTLSFDEAQAYAIADNRTGDLAVWNMEELKRSLAELAKANSGLLPSLGFTKQETKDMLATIADLDIPNIGKSFDEDCASEVEWHICKNCSHTWPK